jgi:hypothetical protein
VVAVTSLLLLKASLVVVPAGSLISWKVVVDVLLVLDFLKQSGLVNLGCEKNRTTYHELRVDFVSLYVIGELMPHGSHDWLCSAGHTLKCSVDIVDQVIALVD